MSYGKEAVARVFLSNQHRLKKNGRDINVEIDTSRHSSGNVQASILSQKHRAAKERHKPLKFVLDYSESPSNRKLHSTLLYKHF